MKVDYTLENVLERAKRCANYSDFQRRYFAAYTWAKETGHLAAIEAVLPPVSYAERAKRAAATKAYTNDELVEDAIKYSTRAAWREAGEQERLRGFYSHYGAAVHRGKVFMRRCCGHMEHGLIGNKHHQVWTDNALVASAQHYRHKSDWKKGDNGAYQAAVKNPDLFKRATAHMTAKANPYAGDYVVYVFEFTDKCAYIGLTFRPHSRWLEHMARGPVAEHLMICPEHTHKQLETGITTPDDAGTKEQAWIERYRADDWTMLNTSDGGGLGTLQRKEWTKEIILAEALKYQTRQAWIDGSQMSYRIAKREGWFAEASAHMPKRKLGVGAGRKVSAATRCKQRKAKLGGTLTKAHRDKISESVRTAWAVRSKWVKENSSLC